MNPPGFEFMIGNFDRRCAVTWYHNRGTQWPVYFCIWDVKEQGIGSHDCDLFWSEYSVSVPEGLKLLSAHTHIHIYQKQQKAGQCHQLPPYPVESIPRLLVLGHYSDIIMGAMASQITSLTTVYSTVYSSADQRKHQRYASMAFVWGIHRWPVNSPHIGTITPKMFPFDDVIMRGRGPGHLHPGRWPSFPGGLFLFTVPEGQFAIEQTVDWNDCERELACSWSSDL